MAPAPRLPLCPPRQHRPPRPRHPCRRTRRTSLEELAALARSVAASTEKGITELLAFLASHGL